MTRIAREISVAPMTRKFLLLTIAAGLSFSLTSCLEKESSPTRKVVENWTLIQAPDMQGNTPLANAIRFGAEKAVIDAFIKEGASVNELSPEFRQNSPMAWAIRRGNEAIFDTLTAAGAKLESPADGGAPHFFFALTEDMKREGDPISSALVLKKGMDINAPIFLGDPNGITALMFVTGHGNLKMVKYLIEKGANPDGKTKNGYTALDVLENPTLVPRLEGYANPDDSNKEEIMKLLFK